jgi:hypothetical protein
VKRPNYNAAKRARELKQKAKREAKLARRQGRTSEMATAGELPPHSPESLEQGHEPHGTPA